MGSGTGSAKTIAAHSVRLTKPFYMAVFPTTQKQWERVMGDWPSYFTNETCRAGRPGSWAQRLVQRKCVAWDGYIRWTLKVEKRNRRG